ncbi:MAG: M15 family metallopeptidase [Oscillospiraceae bacterium]|nr:M15 family metallopeptidase [Oscillospiraceae bacterium]
MSFQNEIRRTNKKGRNPNIPLIVGYAVFAVLCITVLGTQGAFSRKDNTNLTSSAVTVSDVSSVFTVSESESSVIEVSSEASSKSSSKISSVSSVKSISITPVSSENTSSQEQPAYVPNGDWRLVIANKQHPLPKSYTVNTVYLAGGYRIDSRVADSYKAMISAAKNDGITLNLISGFRTYSGQTSLFNNKVNQYRNQGYSKDKATELAAQYVAPPGTSEHLTGLAVDLISTDWYNYNRYLTGDFDKTEEFEWLYSHCAEYGFILRYPKDKESITGYSYEPWHYRYVGVEIAKEIMNKKICLEEYVAGM